MLQLRRVLGLTLMASLAWCQRPAPSANSTGENDLTITILEGEDGANIVKDQTFAETVVEVRDKNNLPIVEGAVTFAVVWGATHTGGGLPGAFANGTNTLTVTTDSTGRAVMSGFRPAANGPVNIHVQASYQGHIGSTVIHQTNFPTTEAAQAAGKTVSSQAQTHSVTNNASQAASHGMSTGAKVALVTVGAAGAAGGAAYGAGLFNTGTNTRDCSSQANQWLQVTQNYAQVCTASSQSQQCVTQVNAYLNAANSFCSCVGGLGDLPAQYRQSLVDALNSIRQFYGASATAPACK